MPRKSHRQQVLESECIVKYLKHQIEMFSHPHPIHIDPLTYLKLQLELEERKLKQLKKDKTTVTTEEILNRR